MRNLTFVILLCCIFENSFSQTVVTGSVRDEQGDPIDYFNAILLSVKDSTMINGVSCRNGILSIKAESVGDVLLQLSSVGYENKTIPFYLSPDNSNMNIGTINLISASFSVDEVVITAKRPAIVSKADRTIVNVQGSVLGEAMDGMDMLQKTPGLMRDRNGGISVLGKGAPIIFIDGRQVRSQEVEMLNPRNIKSVEIIDNPSSAYDAEGHAVVLIHTIKRTENYFFRLGGNYTQSRKASESVFAEGQLSKNKISTNMYYGYSNNNSKNFEYNSRYFNESDKLTSNATSINNTQSHRYRFSIDYNISTKHILGFESNGYNAQSEADMEQITLFTDPASQGFATYSNTDRTPWQINGTLYYNFLMDSLGQSLRFVGDASKISNESAQRYYNVLDGSSTADHFINTNDNDGKNVLYSLKTDYVKPFGKAWKIEAGAKYYFIDSENRTVQTGSTNSEQNYSSEEWNMAGYVSVSTQLNNKMSLRYGLRGEYNHRNGEKNGDRYVDASSFDLFPSILFDYGISKNLKAGLAYTKRISRPALSLLDPSLIVDSLMTRKGNPELKPTKIHAIQLSLSILRDLNIRISYSYRVDPYYFLAIRDENNPKIINVRFENGESTNYYSISASYSKDVLKWFSTSIYGGFWRDYYKYLDDGVYKYNNKPVWFLNTQNSFSLLKILTLDIGFNYYSAGSSGSILNGSYWNLYASLRKDFFNKALTCSISANDIFRKSISNQQTVLVGKNLNRWDGDATYIRLNITYQFGKSRYQYRSKSGSQEELNRIQ